MTLELGPLLEPELGVVAGIFGEALRDSHESLAEATLRHGARLREELARAFARILVARVARAPVGALLSWHVADEVHVLDVAVAGSARRRGVGRALVSALLASARREGARLVLLEVRTSNSAAISLYGEAGFAPFHVRKGYYLDGEDGLEMRLELEPANWRL